MDPRQEQFAAQFIRCQDRVYAYIVTLLPNRADAEEVFQQTSMILWRKWDQFDPSAEFVRWACGIAHFEVLNHIRKAERSTVTLDRDVIDLLAIERLDQQDALAQRREALHECMDTLPTHQRDLLEAAYTGSEPIQSVAERFGRTANAAYLALRRIRKALGDCITRRLEVGR